MNRKIIQLARARRARHTLRQSASAHVEATESVRLEASELAQSARRRLTELKSEHTVELAQVESVRELERMAIEISIAERAVTEASGRAVRADRTAEAALDALRLVERELRITDRALDGARTDERRRVDRAEQRAADDLSASRWRRTG